jgi:hypothetical protein
VKLFGKPWKTSKVFINTNITHMQCFLYSTLALLFFFCVLFFLIENFSPRKIISYYIFQYTWWLTWLMRLPKTSHITDTHITHISSHISKLYNDGLTLIFLSIFKWNLCFIFSLIELKVNVKRMWSESKVIFLQL